MATATFGFKGKVRALGSISGTGNNPRILRMNTFQTSPTNPDPVMDRQITWFEYSDNVKSTNALPVKTATENSEYAGALLFPIAAGRKFSNMTLHFADTGYPLALTFVLEGAENSVVTSYGGAAKLVGQITISF